MLNDGERKNNNNVVACFALAGTRDIAALVVLW